MATNAPYAAAGHKGSLGLGSQQGAQGKGPAQGQVQYSGGSVGDQGSPGLYGGQQPPYGQPPGGWQGHPYLLSGGGQVASQSTALGVPPVGAQPTQTAMLDADRQMALALGAAAFAQSGGGPTAAEIMGQQQAEQLFWERHRAAAAATRANLERERQAAQAAPAPR